MLLTQREFASDIFEFPEIAYFCRSRVEIPTLHQCLYLIDPAPVVAMVELVEIGTSIYASLSQVDWRDRK